MSQNVEVELLCVENDLDWQEKIRAASNHLPGFYVDVTATYKEAVAYLKKKQYDICTFDSRLDDKRPHIHQLVKRIEEKPEAIRPQIIALTSFSEDISKMDRAKVFKVIEKNKVVNDTMTLKRILLDVLRESLTKQCLYFYKHLDVKETISPNNVLLDRIFDRLNKARSSFSADLQKQIHVVGKKYKIYQQHLEILPAETNTLLDCYGYVSAICEKQVEVVLLLPDGQKIKRVFSSDLCLAAGVHYQHASFHYTVIQKEAITSAEIQAGKPPNDYPGVVNMPEIDHSVFDEF